jgi:hypothetical protein
LESTFTVVTGSPLIEAQRPAKPRARPTAPHRAAAISQSSATSERTQMTSQPTVSPLAALVAKRIEELQSRRSQKEIAAAAGFASPNFITMIKTGDAKLPLERVVALARALEVDEHQLMRMAMRQIYDEDLMRLIEASLVPVAAVTANSPSHSVSAKELDQLSLEAVLARIRAGLLRHDLTPTKKLLGNVRNRVDRVEQGLVELVGELDDVLARLKALDEGSGRTRL